MHGISGMSSKLYSDVLGDRRYVPLHMMVGMVWVFQRQGSHVYGLVALHSRGRRCHRRPTSQLDSGGRPCDILTLGRGR